MRREKHPQMKEELVAMSAEQQSGVANRSFGEEIWCRLVLCLLPTLEISVLAPARAGFWRSATREF